MFVTYLQVIDQTSEEKENEPIVATKSDRPSKSFMESSDRTKRRKIKEFSDVLQDIAGHDKANLLLKWLKTTKAKPVLVFLQNEDKQEVIVYVIEIPEKYSKQIQENAKTVSPLFEQQDCYTP